MFIMVILSVQEVWMDVLICAHLIVPLFVCLPDNKP